MSSKVSQGEWRSKNLGKQGQAGKAVVIGRSMKNCEVVGGRSSYDLLISANLKSVLLVSCVWQTKKKMGNRLYYWSCLVQTHAKLMEHLPSNASRGSNWSEPVCWDPFCALIGWHSFDCWMRMKVRHVLRQRALFKPNHCNWSYYLHLTAKF